MQSAVPAYFRAIQELLDRLARDSSEAIETAATWTADSLAQNGALHVFGSGHSMLAAMETAVRAGGLAAVNLIYDPALSPADPDRVSATERLHGYADVSLELAQLHAGEVLLVVSNSGINPVPIEMAIGARDRGLRVVAVTSVAHSRANPPRHRSGQRLCDVVDLVIDTDAPVGDTTLLVGGHATGAVSTILACAALHAITIRVIERLAENGDGVPVLASQNTPGNDDRNAQLLRDHRQARSERRGKSDIDNG